MKSHTVIILIFSAVLLFLQCDKNQKTVQKPQVPETTLLAAEIEHVETNDFFISRQQPLLTHHAWKMFDNDLSTNWFQAENPANTPLKIDIQFTIPVTADQIKIIPYNFESPEFLYYNRINTLNLSLDTQQTTYKAPPGVIIREMVFPEVSFSRCTITVNDIYKGSHYNQMRIAEIGFWHGNQKLTFLESLEYKKVIAFDQYPLYRSPENRKIILQGRGTFFCFPNQQYAQGNTIFKRTGSWSFNPYTMRIHAYENRGAIVEGTGDSVEVTKPYKIEYYEDYTYRDIPLNSSRSIDWLDAVYQGIHMKNNSVLIYPIAGREWQMLSYEETEAVEKYIETQEELYKEVKEKND